MTKRSQLAQLLLLIFLVQSSCSQQVVVEKLKLAKNITPNLTHSFVTSNNVVYQNFLIDLQLGLDFNSTLPLQKDRFILDFNSNWLLALNYERLTERGFNTTKEQGFIYTDYWFITKDNVRYKVSEFNGWVRLDSNQVPSSTVPKSTIYHMGDESQTWRNNRKTDAGLIGLSQNSHFFQSLVNTYKPEQGDSERIPISWSLSPKNEDHLFDSRAIFLAKTFVINGYRATSKQSPMRSQIINGRWYYPNMSFRMGSKWSSYNQSVCIDPDADTFISVPSSDYEKIWGQIRVDICSGNASSICNLSQAIISNMTNVEISFEPASQLSGLGQVAPPPFKSSISLKGSDVIKMFADGNYTRKGITDSSVVRSVCRLNDFIIGRWFFSKAELTFWLNPKNAEDIVLTLAEIETVNKKQRDGPSPPNSDVAAGSIVVLIIILAVVGCVLIAGGVFAYIKKMGSAGGNSNYHTTVEDPHDISNRTFDGKH